MGTRGDYLNQFNMDILRTSQYGSVTTNYNTSTSTSESTGQIIGNIMTMALGIGGAIAMQGAESKAAANAELATQTAAATTKTVAVINKYVEADKALDTAKENINDAVKSLESMEKDLAKAEKATGENGTIAQKKNAKAKLENDTDKTVKTSAETYESLKEGVENAKQLADEHSALEKTNSSLETENQNLIASGQLDSNGKAVQPSGEISIPQGGNKTKAQTLKGGPNSAAVNTLNGLRTQFYVKNKAGQNVDANGKTGSGDNFQAQFDDFSFNQALEIARGLDAKYQANKLAEDKYRDNTTNITKNKSEQTRILQSCKYDKTDPNKNLQQAQDALTAFEQDKGNSNAIAYSAQMDEYTKDINDLTELSDPENLKTLKANIKAKKEEIKGTLTTKLKAAQTAFNNAEKEFNNIKTENSEILASASSLESAKNAADASKKSKKHNLWNAFGLFNKKTTQQKNYKTAKANYAQQSATYSSTYGNSEQIAKAIQTATQQVNMSDPTLNARFKNLSSG